MFYHAFIESLLTFNGLSVKDKNSIVKVGAKVIGLKCNLGGTSSEVSKKKKKNLKVSLYYI